VYERGVCLGRCRLAYPVCHAQAPYSLRPLAPLYFLTSHKRHDFKGKSNRTKNVWFGFLYDFVWNVFHSKKN
jgi:hypothetical protein